jgi:superfamily I DNA and RNA helicase
MLTEWQKKQMQKGFNIGFTDTLIAKSIPGINHMQVYNFRNKLGISSATIVNTRYDVWVKLIYRGASIARIAELYEVTERSLKVLLWKHRNISLIDAKSTMHNDGSAKSFPVHKGKIPNFKKYGI